MLRQASSISLRALRRCSVNSGGNMPSMLFRNSSRAARKCWRVSSGILPSKCLCGLFSLFSHRFLLACKLIIARTCLWSNIRFALPVLKKPS